MPLLQFPLRYEELKYTAKQFDGVIRSELRRRERQLAHKAAREKLAGGEGAAMP